MHAITLWQPYATLIAIGAKEYETRSWSTRCRGDLIIHAAKKRDAAIMTLLQFERPQMAALGVPLPPLVFGAALCLVELVDCIPASLVPDERQRFGDFREGRYAWQLVVKRVFANPVPYRGAQGFWDFPASLIPGAA